MASAQISSDVIPQPPALAKNYTNNPHDSDQDHTTDDKMNIYSGQEFICGWGAASVNIVMTFPLNKLIFRQQLGGIDTRTALRQLEREGLMQLYRGVLPPLLQKSMSLSIMFGTYDKYSKYLNHRFSSGNTIVLPAVVQKAMSAMLAGCTEAALTPLERIQTLLQDKLHRQKYRNTAHAFSELGKHGFAEYYRGLTPILMRNGPSNVLFFLFRNDIKKYMPALTSAGRGAEMARNFASGGLLGALISTVFFPVNVVKARMQCRVGGRFMSFRETLRIVYLERNRSIRGLFRGVHINYTRSLISWGIINATYELLKSFYEHEMPDDDNHEI